MPPSTRGSKEASEDRKLSPEPWRRQQTEEGGSGCSSAGLLSPPWWVGGGVTTSGYQNEALVGELLIPPGVVFSSSLGLRGEVSPHQSAGAGSLRVRAGLLGY
mmetsp:Transcript_17652/g.44608  ORF Transcript_17652/g.44608 Transcript_17652/m.44608 type:complete len:103 (+) Transcript_17652:631-939(+)